MTTDSGSLLFDVRGVLKSLILRLMFGVIAAAFAWAVITAGGNALAKNMTKTIAQAACPATRAAAAQTWPLVSAASEGAYAATILGDSYTAGGGLANPKDSWAYLIGKHEGWATTVVGSRSAGLTDPGPCGEHAFAFRIGTTLATGPDMLIIQGGLKDAAASGPNIRAAADKLLEEAATVPRVVVIGPVSAPSVPALDHVEKALSESAAAYGRNYISARTWGLEFMPDQLHLTAAGHSKFAKLVANHVR